LTNERQKWLSAQRKAHKTGKNAVTFTKVRLDKLGWRYVEFKSKKGYPRDGIIDLVAVKLDRTDHDKLKVILFQVKGGSARMTEKHKARLKEAVNKVEVAYNWAEKPEKSVIFKWEPTEEFF
jgi:hypothetical protein